MGHFRFHLKWHTHVEGVYVDCIEMSCKNTSILQTITVATYLSYTPGKIKRLEWTFLEKHISVLRVITQPNDTTIHE